MNGFELTALVVVLVGTDCTGSWKPNHHTIMTTTTLYGGEIGVYLTVLVRYRTRVSI